MTFTVLDTAAGMREVLTASPDRREDRPRQMLAPMQDMYRYFPGEVDLGRVRAEAPREGVEERLPDLCVVIDRDVVGQVE